MTRAELKHIIEQLAEARIALIALENAIDCEDGDHRALSDQLMAARLQMSTALLTLQDARAEAVS